MLRKNNNCNEINQNHGELGPNKTEFDLSKHNINLVDVTILCDQ